MKTFEEIISDTLRAFDVEYAARYAGGIAGMHYAMARRSLVDAQEEARRLDGAIPSRCAMELMKIFKEARNG